MLAKLPKIDDLQAQIEARNMELLTVIELVIEAAKVREEKGEERGGEGRGKGSREERGTHHH
jgi:hypothetical protein